MPMATNFNEYAGSVYLVQHGLEPVEPPLRSKPRKSTRRTRVAVDGCLLPRIRQRQLPPLRRQGDLQQLGRRTDSVKVLALARRELMIVIADPPNLCLVVQRPAFLAGVDS